MADLKLTLGCGANDRTEALQNGEVKPDGIDLDITTVDVPRALFDRFIFKDEFDVSEYGFYHLIEDVAAGNDAFVGLPIFPSKSFRHRCVPRQSGSAATFKMITASICPPCAGYRARWSALEATERRACLVS
jgi:hypothetical protein